MAPSDSSEDVAERFRFAMRRVAATVAVLSTENAGVRYGMTATAVSSLSVSPPAILTAVNRSSLFHAQVSKRGALCINLLSAHHAAECHAFAGGTPAESRFVDDRWADGQDSLPYMVDAEAATFLHARSRDRLCDAYDLLRPRTAHKGEQADKSADLS